MESYKNYSREKLLQEINRLKTACNTPVVSEQESYSNNWMLDNMIALRKTMSDVLKMLLSSGKDLVIDEALLIILRFFDVDRVYIGIFQEDKNMVDFTHEVTCDGIISMREDLLRHQSEEELPWWVPMIRGGKDIIIHDVSKMPKEASAEQYLLQLQDVQSLLVVAVFHEGKVSGFIGLDSVKEHRRWSAVDIENLRVLADIISVALERDWAQGLMEHSAKQVLKSEAKFQIIFEELPWGVELYDESGNLLDLNQADLDIFGTTKEEAIGVNMFKNPNIPESINHKLRKGEDVTFALNYNFHVVNNSGYYSTNIHEKIKHLQVKGVTLKDLQGAIFGYLYIVFDDTENYLKSEQTEDNLAKLKVAMDTGESVIWEYDVATQKMVIDFSLNEDIEDSETLSYIKKHQITNRQEFLDTLHPDDVDEVYNKQFKRLLKGEINNYVSSYRRLLGGRTFWFNSNVRSYKFNEDGTPSKVVSYTSNITKQRESETELIKVKEADKLKSAFLANMSHEIRTPLNAIVGFSNIISETLDEAERQTYLDIIHKNNDLLLHLIDDILDFSKIESGILNYKIGIADIKQICNEVALSDSLKIGPDVHLIFDDKLPSAFVRTDEKRIVQVLSNFVNNAIKFTKLGNITISYRQEGNRVRVSVQDTGIGIAEEDRKRIFDRFIKVNSFKQGTGLGLTISKTIIENLGGTIGVDSVAGEGSTFWFTLPLDKEIEVAPNLPTLPLGTQELAADYSKQHSILIAEDISENYLLLQTLFSKKYQLYHAWNGEEAVELFRKHQPDLILMDIKMPVMDGFEATRHIRQLSPTVPIIALTAFAYEKEKSMARDYHFTDYVVKPIDIALIRRLVSKTLN